MKFILCCPGAYGGGGLASGASAPPTKEKRERKGKRKKKGKKGTRKRKDRKVNKHEKQGSREENFRGTKFAGEGIEGDFLHLMLQGAKINDSLGPPSGYLLDTPLLS